jgi:thiol-disulfide isomerase/thioredoxin
MVHRWIVSAFCCLIAVGIGDRAFAQSKLALPGCEAPRELRQTLHDKLGSPEFDQLNSAQREAIEQQVLTELAEKYPRELEPVKRQISRARNQQDEHPEKLAALQAKYQKLAAEHPDDPLILYLAATTLKGKETPESIRLANRAIELAPNFAWPSLYLADLYSRGKTLDKQKSSANLKQVFALCPASFDGSAQWLLGKDTELQAKVEPAERAYLESATDPETLKNYTNLWGLEFRIHPPQEYPAVRKQVAADVERLEKANPKPDAGWAAFLIEGVKQSGASPEAVKAQEDKLLAAYSQSDEALEIVETRWREAHKDPEKQDDTAAWTQYRAAYRAAVQEWIRAYPNSYNSLVQTAFFAAYGDHSITETEGMAALDTYLKQATEHWGSPSFTTEYAADFLLEHHWQPERTLELLEQVREHYAKSDAIDAANDNRSEKDLKEQTENNTYRDQELARSILLAATRSGKPEAALKLKSAIEAAPPTDKKFASDYWRNRALLAVLEGRKADGLVYYQLALQVRQQQPKFVEGRFEDELGDEARELWKQLGGSDAAWAAWSQKPQQPTADADAARWEKPTLALPEFSLTDLSGKSWKLAELHGKTVLINLWATWCGPCNAELPHLQKLYDQVKDRSDIQILTFSIDEEPGLLDAFLKKKGYTFPVLPAYAFTLNLLNGYSIPQNWIVDSKGTWLWTQIGYGADDAWQKDMLAKIESVKAGNESAKAGK